MTIDLLQRHADERDVAMLPGASSIGGWSGVRWMVRPFRHARGARVSTCRFSQASIPCTCRPGHGAPAPGCGHPAPGTKTAWPGNRRPLPPGPARDRPLDRAPSASTPARGSGTPRGACGTAPRRRAAAASRPGFSASGACHCTGSSRAASSWANASAHASSPASTANYGKCGLRKSAPTCTIWINTRASGSLLPSREARSWGGVGMGGLMQCGWQAWRPSSRAGFQGGRASSMWRILYLRRRASGRGRSTRG
ncbi:hypothetical protein SAMN04489708_113103 [Paracidovorax cattleyae]|uniref:Uncharacterized protein n=1 Tax=Paracidovorax cattleyae TaxID=80868 RepID=A0A1H0SW82_9BURK|nr:hypothetical protein SAMN04489708_113103 [Paracidovorax cattleyae]